MRPDRTDVRSESGVCEHHYHQADENDGEDRRDIDESFLGALSAYPLPVRVHGMTLWPLLGPARRRKALFGVVRRGGRRPTLVGRREGSPDVRWAREPASGVLARVRFRPA